MVVHSKWSSIFHCLKSGLIFTEPFSCKNFSLEGNSLNLWVTLHNSFQFPYCIIKTLHIASLFSLFQSCHYIDFWAVPFANLARCRVESVIVFSFGGGFRFANLDKRRLSNTVFTRICCRCLHLFINLLSISCRKGICMSSKKWMKRWNKREGKT